MTPHDEWEQARQQRDLAARRLAYITTHGGNNPIHGGNNTIARPAAEEWQHWDDEMTRLDTRGNK